MLLILLAIVSFIGGAAASALFRLITSNTGRVGDKVPEKDEPGSNEKSLHESVQDQAKAGYVEAVSVLQMQGGKKKKHSKHSRQIVQRTDKASQQSAKDDAGTTSGKDAKEGEDTRKGSGKEVQSTDSEKAVQCTSGNGLNQSKQLSLGNVSSLQVRGGKKKKHSKHNRQIV